LILYRHTAIKVCPEKEELSESVHDCVSSKSDKKAAAFLTVCSGTLRLIGISDYKRSRYLHAASAADAPSAVAVTT
jgi:hypothetical protein